MITVNHAGKDFGDFRALDDVSLQVPAGSLTALLGPSGSGKSTLLRAIAGLENLDRGSIWIDGRDVTHVPAQQRGIGFVFQHYAAFRHMTVRDNVGFGLTIRKRPRADVRARAEELLALVGLEGLEDRYPSQLSGGQRQRMALARALAIEPSVLLLDEPFGALDAKVRTELRDWLRRMHAETNVTTLLVTHDQEEALDVADHIAVLHQGRLEQVGGPTDLYDNPANPFVMGFLGSVSQMGNTLVRPQHIELHRVISPEAGAGPQPEAGAEAAAGSGAAELPAVVLDAGSVTEKAMVQRVTHLGFETRVELVNHSSGAPFSAALTRKEADRLDLSVGELVWASAPRDPAREADDNWVI